MPAPRSIWNAAVALSGVALLTFLARTFIDFRFVYAEVNAPTGIATLINLVLVAGWIAAVTLASHDKRRAMYVLLGYDLLVVAFGVATIVSFCPSPCRTGWPTGEIAMWSNLVFGGGAALCAALALFGKRGSVRRP